MISNIERMTSYTKDSGINVLTYTKNSIPLFLVVLIVFVSNDCFFFTINSNPIIESIPRYFSLLLCLCLLLKAFVEKKHIKPKSLIILLFFIIAVLVSSFINNDNLNRTITTIIFLTEAFLLILCYDFNDLLDKFEKTIYFLSVVSIVVWILWYIANPIICSFPKMQLNDHYYYNLFICGVQRNLAFSSSTIMRSNSIFWEAGVFQIYLNFGLCCCLFKHKTISIRRVITFLVALVLTFSTASFFCMITLLFIFFIKKYSNRNKNDIKKIKKTKITIVFLSFFALLVLFAFLGFDRVFDTYFSKLTASGNGSTGSRIASIIVNGYVALQNPIFGTGTLKLDQLFTFLSVKFNVVPSYYLTLDWSVPIANTIMYNMAVYGIPYGLFYFIGLIKSGKVFGFQKIELPLWSLYMFLLLCGETLCTSVLLPLFVFAGFNYLKGGNNYA